jgi:prevent-host-death family protein
VDGLHKDEVELKLHLMPKSRTVTMLDLRRHAERILRQVQGGQPLMLTYRGRPVLRLEPLEVVRRDRTDPFYALADLADKGGSSLTNEQIDEIVYGA